MMLSVIVPNYNGEKNIEKLFSTFLLNNSSDFEIIFVDDGSTDGSLNTIKKIKENTNLNINIVSKENGGVSKARNAGLSVATGEYITFCDVDDYYEPYAIDYMLSVIENYDLYCFSFYNVVGDNKIAACVNNNQVLELGKNDGLIGYLSMNYWHTFGNSNWNKVFNKSIIDNHNIQFNTHKKIGEDMIFNLEYIENIKSIKFINKPLYNYVLHSESTMRRYGKDTVEDINKNWRIYRDLMKKSDFKDNDHLLESFQLLKFYGILSNELKAPNYKTGKNKLKKFVESTDMKKGLNDLNFSKLNKKGKIYYILIKTKLYKLLFFIKYKMKVGINK